MSLSVFLPLIAPDDGRFVPSRCRHHLSPAAELTRVRFRHEGEARSFSDGARAATV